MRLRAVSALPAVITVLAALSLSASPASAQGERGYEQNPENETSPKTASEPATDDAGFSCITTREAKPAEWSHVQVDPTDYFEPEEIHEWGSYARSRRAISLAAIFLSIFLYSIFVFTQAGKAVHSFASNITCGLGNLALLQTRPAERISAALSRLFGSDWAPALVFTWLFLFIVTVCILPLQLAAEYLAQSAGISVYTTAAWIWDFAKRLLLNTASYTCIVLGLFGLVRRMPRRWWLALGLPAALCLVAWGAVSPYQARIFYEFSPLADDALHSRFEALAQRQGLTLADVQVIDASRHTRGINAYFTGLGPSRELVLYDTLIEALKPEEMEAALAHELGHVERENPILRYLLSALVLVGLLWMLSRVLLAAAPRLGLDGPGDPRALPLLLLVVTLCFLAARPAERAWLRHEERLADRTGLALTGDPDAFVRMLTAVGRHNRADVDPPSWAVFWFATHPPLVERIGMALWYAQWLQECSGKKTAEEVGGSVGSDNEEAITSGSR